MRNPHTHAYPPHLRSLAPKKLNVIPKVGDKVHFVRGKDFQEIETSLGRVGVIRPEDIVAIVE